METFNITNLKAMLKNALLKIKEREAEFSQLDAVTGDGDHGEAIVTAMSAVVETAEKGTSLKQCLSDMGFDVMLKTSGSTSTLLGALFLGMADGVAKEDLNAAEVKTMFEAGLKNVQQQTKAKKGDKTMMDALIPAVEAMQESTSSDIKTVMQAAADAALQGAKATINMKANFGRARNYGEKSIGTADSGATSWACMFGAFAESL